MTRVRGWAAARRAEVRRVVRDQHGPAGADVRRCADHGQVLVLTIGVVVLAVLLILVVASAAQVHLEHKKLVALTDLLAIEAADAITDEVYYGSEGDARLRLTGAAVREAVEDYLAQHPGETRGWRQVQIQEATATGPRTARVSMAARVRPAATAWVLAAWSDGVVITATSSATAD